MSSRQALNTSLSGLRATQAGLSLVAANVANARDAGLCPQDARSGRDRRPATPASACASTASTASSISTCSASCGSKPSGGAYADLRVAVLSAAAGASTARPAPTARSRRCSTISPTALQALSTSPDSTAARSQRAQRGAGAGAAAQRPDRRHPGAAQRRRERPCRRRRAPPTTRCSRSPQLNQQLAGTQHNDASDATLLDQRDQYIDQLSQLMDIRVVTERPQPGQRLHQFRHAARRHAGLAARVRCRRAR